MNFLDRLLGRTGPASKDIAKNRLQLVLVHDRAKIPPALLETLKDELIAVISKYVTIDPEGVEVNLDPSSGYRLVADIPILSTEAPRRPNANNNNTQTPASPPHRSDHKQGHDGKRKSKRS